MTEPSGYEMAVYLGLLAFFAAVMVAGMQPTIYFVMDRLPNFFGAFLVMFTCIVLVSGMMFGAAYLAGVLT